MSAERKQQLMVGAKRRARTRKVRSAELSAGVNLGSGGIEPRSQSAIDFTPAVWMSPLAHVGDCQYVEYGLDEVLVRALHNRVVYADRLGHHEPCFQEITVDVLAAVDKACRKTRPDPAPVAKGLLKSFKLPKAPVVKPAITLDKRLKDITKIAKATGYREGKSLAEVVAELMGEA
jgi:hypothetical protein